MNRRKDIVENEFGKLGDAIATSLGCMVIALAVFAAIVFVMKEIYCCPLERDYEDSSNGVQSRQNIAVPLATNPTYKWHPSNIYHRR